jgi:hypothetical protein
LSATARHDRPDPYDATRGAPGTASAAAALLPAPAARAAPAKRRLKIWQISSAWLCSIVGTCLGPADVDRIVRRAGVRFPDGTEAYDVHGFMVARAAEQGRVGREINKVLDDKYAALVRKVGAEGDQARLAALWNDLCGRGQIAGAYWAIMSHAHVGEAIKMHAFGEVHMLSHFMGGHNRHNVKELWLTQRRLDRLADTLARTRRQIQETVAARERRIDELEQELSPTQRQLAAARLAGTSPASAASAGGGARRRSAERDGRRLAAARARLAALEADNQRLRALLGVLIETVPRKPTPGSEPRPVPTGVEPAAPQLEGGCILYVGGRCQLLPHLRACAAAANACLLHHDGGQEESLHSLGRLVDRADVVLCPIDCVSHQACLKVKVLCRRRAKPFVPLRSSSATCFARAIRALQGAPIERSALAPAPAVA